MNYEKLPDLLTVTEVADLLRVSSLKVKGWEDSRGVIPLRINSRGDRRYKKKDIIDIIENNNT